MCLRPFKNAVTRWAEGPKTTNFALAEILIFKKMADVELHRMHGSIRLDINAKEAAQEMLERMACHRQDDMRGQPKDGCLLYTSPSPRD